MVCSPVGEWWVMEATIAQPLSAICSVTTLMPYSLPTGTVLPSIIVHLRRKHDPALPESPGSPSSLPMATDVQPRRRLVPRRPRSRLEDCDPLEDPAVLAVRGSPAEEGEGLPGCDLVHERHCALVDALMVEA